MEPQLSLLAGVRPRTAHGELAGVYERHSRVNERIIDKMLGGQIRRTGHHLHGLDSVTAHHHRRSNTRLR